MTENEFRVRPVTRYNLTHHQDNGLTGSTRSLGEFDTIEKAEEVGQALNCLVPGSVFTTLQGRIAGDYPLGMLAQAIERDTPQRLQYVIVAVNTFEVETKAYFAQSMAEAEARKAEAEEKHGTEFRIFSRPVVLGQIGAPRHDPFSAGAQMRGRNGDVRGLQTTQEQAEWLNQANGGRLGA